jgi:hypothetical protein
LGDADEAAHRDAAAEREPTEELGHPHIWCARSQTSDLRTIAAMCACMLGCV